MDKEYTKGDKNKVVTRLNQVSSITLHVPSSCECMNYLYDGLITLCNHYVNNDNADSLLLIPNIDFFNVVLYVNKCCKEKDINTDYLHAMMGIVRSFDNLKYISISFDEDGELIDSFDRLANIDSNNIVNDVVNELFNIYSIDVLEIYFGDILDQSIIDLINKSFISNGIISNSYLERDFVIDFEFDEYISYINMFIDNNIDMLKMYDEDIIDYLRVFPSIVGDISKPAIKLYTNYKEI